MPQNTNNTPKYLRNVKLSIWLFLDVKQICFQLAIVYDCEKNMQITKAHTIVIIN